MTELVYTQIVHDIVQTVLPDGWQISMGGKAESMFVVDRGKKKNPHLVVWIFGGVKVHLTVYKLREFNMQYQSIHSEVIAYLDDPDSLDNIAKRFTTLFSQYEISANKCSNSTT